MNSTNLRIWETNKLIKELRKCSALFALHNLRFWRRTEADFFQWWCLHTDYYKQTQLIWNALNKLIQLDLSKRKIQCFSCCFKNDAVLFGRPEICSNLSENNWFDVEEDFCLVCLLLLPCGWKRTNCEWSCRFKTLFPQLPLLFFWSIV